MFFRKPGLPILMVRMPDGTEKPYWNTFYQQVDYPCPDARELVSELGMQYRSACVLTESLRIQLAAGKRPAELDLGRWETLRASPDRPVGIPTPLFGADGFECGFAIGVEIFMPTRCTRWQGMEPLSCGWTLSLMRIRPWGERNFFE